MSFEESARFPTFGGGFGIFVPQVGLDFQAVIDAAVRAEHSGFQSFWLMDHLFAPAANRADALESWTLISAIAVATGRIRLGHLVGCNPFRHPAVLAKMAATVDRIAGGRFELGLGWGSIESEFDMFGIEYDSPRCRSEQLAETIEIVRAMFSGEPFDYEGKHFRLSGAFGLPRPVNGSIPIHIGGAGRQLTMPIVAELADWWNCPGAARTRLEDLARRAGNARVSAQYAVGMITDEAQRAKVVERTHRRLPESGWGPAMIGTPAELVQKFAAEFDRGIELCIVRLHDLANLETIDVFGREVASVLTRGNTTYGKRAATN
ncbi:LLM class flavin-dependent oxidoreductase [Rhodococcoides kyotonense]|uniref:Luciferase-like monooxygenase n=1 Tax=Rhodococcoides kyotonense TaxID=398843 RepID=A0A239M2C5_9NOCA|nr:LLM class flavin-dependent oxidoreductase [Rhodococcus kyotonensis]SNT36462.1 Luciferase-like monooxygenase [Rhodococcus kyotonensis]